MLSLKDYSVIKKCQLFNGLEDDITKIISCLKSKTISYDRDSFAIMEDDPIESMGIILSGRVRIIREYADGNIDIIGELADGEIFGVAMVCAGIKNSMVTVKAVEKCKIMYLDYRKIINVCPSVCKFHLKIIKNLIELVAAKNLMLQQKMEIVTKKTIREKLLNYFAIQSKTAKSRKFSIPFNRTDLAFYIGADRSSMTRELYRMQNDGLIRLDKKNFELLKAGKKT